MLKEIIEKCEKLNISEKREATDNYYEAVFSTKDTDQWNNALSEILGPAVKPAGTKPNKEDQRLTRQLGGIYENQTLFKKEFDSSIIIAMFWPWQDGEHTTLKIAHLAK